MYSLPKLKAGFTLIELLVVIAIIGILSSVLLANITETQRLARDSNRIQDMREIRKALELFYIDHNRYPGTPTVVSGAATNIDGITNNGEFIGIGDDIDTALSPYLNPVPRDPLHDGTVYFYSYDPGHGIDLDCSLWNDSTAWETGGLVFAFNKAEATTNLNKDTCVGSNKNQHNADFNQGIILNKN